MLRYIELKSGYNDDGPAWIGYVKLSRSGRTVYFNGRALKQGTGSTDECQVVGNGSGFDGDLA